MKSVLLSDKSKFIMIFRILIEVSFLTYVITLGESFTIWSAILVAIVASEGYKILGSIATNQTYKNKEIIGLIIGVLNGILFMMTLYLTGYTSSELWMFSIISILLTAIEYGFYGSISEGIVMMALYVITSSIESLDYKDLFFRAFIGICIAGISGYIANREITFEQRFTELEKRSKLTKEQKLRFVGVVSHSLRTPLTSIRGYIDLLLKERAGKLKKEQLELVEKMDSEAGELHELLEDFLLVSTLESEKIRLEYSSFNICKLCSEIHEELFQNAQNKGLEFTFSKNTDICDYDGERSKLESAIKNLVENAIKFTPQDGKIFLRINKEKDNIYIEIEDTGIGIPKEEQSGLFDMFSRATNVLKYEYKGIGLGLYMSRLIVEAHGGRLELESEEGVGTKFTIILPTGKLGKIIRKLNK